MESNLMSNLNSCKALLAVTPEWGTLMPAICIAKILLKRGWRILFLLPSEAGDFPIDEHQLEKFKSYLDQQNIEYVLSKPFPTKPNNILKKIIYFSSLAKFIFYDTVRIIKENQINILLTDCIVANFFVSASAECGIPHALLGNQFINWINAEIPPVYSNVVPIFTSGSKIKVINEWAKYYFLRHSLIILDPFSLLLYFDLIRKRVAMGFSDWGLLPKTPKILYLMPKELDFKPRSDGYYLGNIIDFERQGEEDIKIELLDENKPLVYISLGTLSWQTKEISLNFYKAALAEFNQLPQYQFLLNINNSVEIEQLGTIPENTQIYHWVPQLKVLEESSLMITNGGINTVKECISFGVPMIILPVKFDQFGNAARVVYHKIGVQGNIRTMTSSRLGELIKKVLNDPSYMNKIKSMQKECLEVTELDKGIDYLEKLV